MKMCDCKKWQEDSKYDHHEDGKMSYKNTWIYCPWCRKRLKEIYKLHTINLW